MLLSQFSYHLPGERIAQHPLEERDQSRLLVLERQSGALEHKRFYELTDYLEPGDTLVFNNTRVIPARLIGTRADTGGKVEVFLLNRLNDTDWETLVKPGKRARPGMTITFGDELGCEIVDTTDFGGRVVRFSFTGVFEAVLDRLGETPLPPYIHERLSDSERYQTVYATQRGSAAAPTAGLHFTPPLLERIAAKGIQLAYVTLHVGLGTFRPVSAEKITDHVMHREFYTIPEATARIVNETRARGNRVIAVGTTSVRTLETVGQSGEVQAGSGYTNIFIYPGYRFRIVDGLITNFHLPESTLLMLVSAFAGREQVLGAYETAIKEEYRFFSFGDAMLIR